MNLLPANLSCETSCGCSETLKAAIGLVVALRPTYWQLEPAVTRPAAVFVFFDIVHLCSCIRFAFCSIWCGAVGWPGDLTVSWHDRSSALAPTYLRCSSENCLLGERAASGRPLEVLINGHMASQFRLYNICQVTDDLFAVKAPHLSPDNFHEARWSSQCSRYRSWRCCGHSAAERPM